MGSIDTILNENNNGLLLESGIKMPKGTRAAKLFVHADLDGVFSGILTMNQLIRQGIPKKNITVDFVQYGDDKNEMADKLEASKGQMVSIVDFASIPDEVPTLDDEGKKDYKNMKKVRQSDFTSDHHDDSPDIAGNKRLAKGKAGAIGKTEYGSDSEHIATVYAKNLADPSTVKIITMVDAARYPNLMDTITLPKRFREAGRMERLGCIVNSLVSQLISKNKTAAIELIRTSSPSIVSLYNNSLKLMKISDKQAEVFEEMGKENPDWNRIAILRSQLPMNFAKKTGVDDKKVNKLRSLDDFREKGKEDMENAASGYWSKKDEEELNRLLKVAKEGTAYVAKDKLDKYKEDIEDAIKSTKREIDNMEDLASKGQKDKVVIFQSKKRWRNSEGKYEMQTEYLPVEKFDSHLADIKAFVKEFEEKLAKIAEVSEADAKVDALKAEKKEKNGKFHGVGNVIRQDATSLRDYPGRYVSSLQKNKEGNRYPFVLKRFSNMIQVALNPDYPKDKAKPDLGELSRKILKEMRDKYATKWDSWAWDIVFQESGGHAAITNVSGLGTIKLLPKAKRDRMKELEDYKKRAGKKFKDIMPNKANELDGLTAQKKKLQEEKEKIIQEIEVAFYKELNKYKDSWVTTEPGAKVEKEEEPKDKIVIGKKPDKNIFEPRPLPPPKKTKKMDESVKNVLKDLLQ